MLPMLLFEYRRFHNIAVNDKIKIGYGHMDVDKILQMSRCFLDLSLAITVQISKSKRTPNHQAIYNFSGLFHDCELLLFDANCDSNIESIDMSYMIKSVVFEE